MNNKGQVSMVAFMIAIVVIIIAMALAFPTRQVADNAYNQTYDDGRAEGMDCSNSSISDYVKAPCIIADITPAFFIGGLIGLAGLIAGAKILWG